MERLFNNVQLGFLTVFLLALNVYAGGAIAGKVTIVRGQVFIVRGSEKIQIVKDITVLESDVIEANAGGTARITMIDSNLVDVYPKSKVEIAKYVYKPNEDRKDVELKVDFGKIKSTVNQKYDGAKNKFQVKTPSAVAGVRGTVFTTEYDAVKKTSKVVTIEGLVAVTKVIDRERQSPPVFVRPNQEVDINPNQVQQEKPRDLKPEERDNYKKEDKDLGYQYDPKKEQAESTGEASTAAKDSANKEPAPKEVAQKFPNETLKENIKELKKDFSTDIKDNAEKQISKNKNFEEQQDKKQNKLEEQQANKQKQVEEQQTHKQKQLEEQQGKKQKQLEEEQVKKQKYLEEQQGKKQKQLEEEQVKKQKYLEEQQAKKQKQLEEEQAKKQKLAEELQIKKQKQLEEQQAKRQQLLEEAAKKREEQIKQPEEAIKKRVGEISTIKN